MGQKKVKVMNLMRATGMGLDSIKPVLVDKGFAEDSTDQNSRMDRETAISVLDVMLKRYKSAGIDVNKTTKYREELAKAEVATELKEENSKKEGVEAPKVKASEADKPKVEEPKEKIEEKKEVKKESNLKVVGTLPLEEKGKTKKSTKKTVKAEPKKKVELVAEVNEEKAEPKVEKKKETAVKETLKAEKKEDIPKAKEEPTPKVEDKKDKASKVEEASKEDANPSSNKIETETLDPGIKFNVVGEKIDLNQFKKPKSSKDKKKRTRKKQANNPIDVDKEGKKIAAENANKPNNNKGKGHNQQQNNSGQGNQRRKDQRKKDKARKPAPKAEISDEEVQRQVKENLARLTNRGNKGGAQHKREKRQARLREDEKERENALKEASVLQLTEFVTVSDLASLMDVPVNKVIATCMSLGLMVSINMRLDAETIDIVAEEFGFTTNFVSAEDVEDVPEEVEEDNDVDLLPRSPIVTVMGHVDHGKTSLLDYLRSSNVIEGEAGGITQHIGAYSIKVGDGKRITFLDTPGHEAFTAMRARGAKVTDIAIIIVAADDDVMPQTKEAINHASAAGVPMVFAINKIDKPGANPDRIREQLAAMNYLVEEWGGKYQCQEISAKQGTNIEELLEKVLLEAELLELKANPSRKASGTIIESSLDKGRGYVATLLVQNGTLRTGDVLLSGTHFGKVKAMFNERNQRVEEVGPSLPVLILGLDGAPTAGEVFNTIDTEQEARSIANKREQLKREMETRTKKGLTLEELARRRAMGNFQELNLIVKGDVDGSIEALADSLIRLSTEEIQVNVIHKGVGAITESDIVLAAASSAIVIGFQVRPIQTARRMAEAEGVEIRTYSIIYDTIDDIKSAMEGMLSPEIKENVVANLEVQQTFKIGKLGTIAGCMVLEGKIKRTNKIRLIRDGIVKYAGELGSLKRFKDDVKEVVIGQDCGLNIEGYNDIIVGDIIEAYEEIEVKKKL